MALRTILEYPDPRLRTRAQPVTRFDAALGTLIDDMFETMYAAPGIGLAATQVDVHQRLIVIDISPDRNQRSEEHTSELQSPYDLVCRLLLEKKKSLAAPPDVTFISLSPARCLSRPD